MTTELPDVKLRALVNFPVSVTGRTAIAIEKTNGRYYLDLDVSGLVQNPNISVDQVDQSWMLIWNEVDDAYQLVPYALAATAGVASIEGKTGALDIGVGLKFTGDTLEVDSETLPDGVFDTVAALQAASIPTGVDRVTVRGFYAANDGGGGDYYLSASEPTKPGYQTSFDGKFWDLPDRSIINARRLGAKSDNAFDNTPVAIDCLAALPEWGGTIVWPPSDGLALYSFDTPNPFVLADKRSIRITGGGSPTSFFNIQQPTFIYKAATGSLVVGFGGNGIEIDHINLTYSSSFTNYLIDLSKYEAEQLTAFIDIHHCGILGNSGALTANGLILLSNTLSTFIRMNMIGGAIRGIVGPATTNEAANLIVIEKNWFQQFTSGFAIRVSGQNWDINSNVFEPVDLATLKAGAIVTALSVNPPQALNIRNNNFTDAGETGIWIDFSGCPVDSAEITGNFGFQGEYFCHLGGSTAVHITGNTIYTRESSPAIVGDCSALTAKSNKLRTNSGINPGTLLDQFPIDLGSEFDNCDGKGIQQSGRVKTVATLPSAVGLQGVRFTVTDANSTTFMSTVVGGGSNKVPVFSDGTNWKIG